MTKRAKPSNEVGAPSVKLDIQRVRVNRDGYDASGAYWGSGPDVYIATAPDGSEEITVRALSVSEAGVRVAAELARQPGATKLNDAPLGGTAPRKTRYEIDWQNAVSAETVRIRITHARDYLVQGTDHVEVESIKPRKAPLPITSTGYLSHFIPALELANAGGPVTFVTAWIEREAAGKAWQKQTAIKAQGDLFQWAEANKEVAARKSSKPKPSKPMPKPRKKPASKRTPG